MQRVIVKVSLLYSEYKKNTYYCRLNFLHTKTITKMNIKAISVKIINVTMFNIVIQFTEHKLL